MSDFAVKPIGESTWPDFARQVRIQPEIRLGRR